MHFSNALLIFDKKQPVAYYLGINYGSNPRGLATFSRRSIYVVSNRLVPRFKTDSKGSYAATLVGSCFDTDAQALSAPQAVAASPAARIFNEAL